MLGLCPVVWGVAAAVYSSGKKVTAERSVGGCDLLPGCGSGEAEENDVTKAGHWSDKGFWPVSGGRASPHPESVP